jgi:hypothetical protein
MYTATVIAYEYNSNECYYTFLGDNNIVRLRWIINDFITTLPNSWIVQVVYHKKCTGYCKYITSM